jgi:hypothetical protein
MDSSFRRQGSGTRKKSGFLADRQIFDGILPLMRHFVNWLADLLKLTEEEQEAAGIYLGRVWEANKYQSNAFSSAHTVLEPHIKTVIISQEGEKK